MLRTRDLLTVTLPAALLAFAVQPLLDTSAPAVEVSTELMESRLDRDDARGDIGPARIRIDAAGGVTIAARDTAPSPATAPAEGTRSANEVAPPLQIRPRPRVGCEGAISALAGREARNLLPSRCLV